ncbi:hypothetical protein BC937DRAFT_88661, partial [Endogone sp. FLAS-F59071]
MEERENLKSITKSHILIAFGITCLLIFRKNNHSESSVVNGRRVFGALLGLVYYLFAASVLRKARMTASSRNVSLILLLPSPHTPRTLNYNGNTPSNHSRHYTPP